MSCTAEEAEAMLARGESGSREVPDEEALRRRRADPGAPLPYPGWEETIVVGVPEAKEQVTLRLDRDVLR